MELTLELGKILADSPASNGVLVTLSIVVFLMWLKNKKALIEEKKSDREVQSEQVESLMQQLKLLSEELDKTRKQLHELHDQNVILMGQLRSANQRISELEVLIGHAPHHVVEHEHAPIKEIHVSDVENLVFPFSLVPK